VTLLRPDLLPLLLLAPVAWVLLFGLDRARARRLSRIVGPRATRLGAERSEGRRRAGRALLAGGLFLAVVAALGPAWGGSGGRERRGVDVVVCLDVSRSMLARDLPPDRLACAKREIRDLAGRARGDRLGLVVFAGEARMMVPLTEDMASFAQMAEQADPLAVRRGGTDLGAALDAALGLLKGSAGVIVLMTDGEDLSGRGLAAARKCRERGVTVHALGFGTALGSKIAVETGAGETYVKDRSGREVVSAMDAESLRRIAAAAGGRFAEAPALRDLYEDTILRMEGMSSGPGQHEDRFQWPLLGAVALWLVDLGLSRRRRR
jgi:Ca-activated chloride channel family protein